MCRTEPSGRLKTHDLCVLEKRARHGNKIEFTETLLMCFLYTLKAVYKLSADTDLKVYFVRIEPSKRSPEFLKS